MEAAARVFARRGLQRASVDEVAADAGFTKGAFYANFKSKEELFLAMLDEHFAARLAETEHALADDAEPEEQARHAGEHFSQAVRSDPEWERLFFEFAGHAARDDEFREEFMTRYRSLRERYTELFRRRAETFEHALPLPMDQITLMTFAMGTGYALEQLLDPEAFGEDFYGTMLMVFFTGLRTLATETAAP